MLKLSLPEDHTYFLGRTCSTCKIFKTSDQFRLEVDFRCNYGIAMRSKCIVCDEERKWKADLQRKYKITYEEYINLLESQNFCCAICKSSGTNNSRVKDRFFVDHDHKTKQVRGLLCSKCNQGLGQFNDNPNLLKQAIKYLSKTVL